MAESLAALVQAAGEAGIAQAFAEVVDIKAAAKRAFQVCYILVILTYFVGIFNYIPPYVESRGDL